MVKFISLLVLLGLLVGCAEDDQGSVDAAARKEVETQRIIDFVEARYSEFEAALRAYPRYVELVMEGEPIPPELLRQGHLLYEEYEFDANARFIDDFIDSIEGVDWSKEDFQHIAQALERRESREFAEADTWEARLSQPAWEAAQEEHDLFNMYLGSVTALQVIDDLSDEALENVFWAVREHLQATDRPDVWQALVRQDGVELVTLEDDDPAMIGVYNSLGVFLGINALLGSEDLTVPPMETRIVTRAVFQAIWMSGFGYVEPRLKATGFNDFMGRERLDRLHERALRAVRTVDAWPLDLSLKDARRLLTIWRTTGTSLTAASWSWPRTMTTT